MEWTQVPDGLISGPFRIVRLDGGGGWRLYYQDRLVEETSNLSIAVADAGTYAEAARRRRRIRRLAVILFLACAGIATAYPFRSEPNPDYVGARAVVDRLAAIQSDVLAGAYALDSVPARYPGTVVGLAGGSSVVTEALGTDCYYITWAPDKPATRWVLPGRAACSPEVVAAERGNYIGGDQSLPPTRRTPQWFYPTLVVLLVVALNCLISLFNLATRPAHQETA